MATLYVLSTETYSGKTAVVIGLGLRMRDDGFSVGYMKPVNTNAVLQAGQPYDEDVVFIKQIFDLPEPLDVLAPVQLTPQRIQSLLAGGDPAEFAERLRGAYRQVRAGHDLVLMEGASSLREGYVVDLAPPDLARIVGEEGSGAKALAVIRYDDARSVDHFLAAQKRLGSRPDGRGDQRRADRPPGVRRDRAARLSRTQGHPGLRRAAAAAHPASHHGG